MIVNEVLFKLAVVFLWSDESFGLLFSEVLALLRFLRLSGSVRNFLLCRLLAVLYAKYLWERILDATSGVKSDIILSSSRRCSCSLMAMILRNALLLSFRTNPNLKTNSKESSKGSTTNFKSPLTNYSRKRSGRTSATQRRE